MQASVLVTGGSSPLGDIVLPELVRVFGSVAATSRSPKAMMRIASAGAIPIECDLRDIKPLDLDADVVVHLAGINFGAAAAALVRMTGATRLVAISSASATATWHPRRDEVLAAEAKFQQIDAVTSIIRPTMIYGSPRERNVSRIVTLCQRSPAVPLISGGGRLMPVFADDVASAIVELAQADSPLPLAPLSGPTPLALGQMVDAVCIATNTRRLRITAPLSAPIAIAKAIHDPRSKLIHAVQMLEVDRIVETPSEAGFRFASTDFESGVRTAIRRYPSGKRAN